MRSLVAASIAALFAISAPASAQTLVVICTAKYTWTYAFDLSNGTVEASGAFQFRAPAIINADKIEWTYAGENYRLDRYSGILYTDIPADNVHSQWSCRAAPKRAIQ